MRLAALPAVAVLLAVAPVESPPPLTDRQIFVRGAGALVDVMIFQERGASLGSGAPIGRDRRGDQVVLTSAHLFDLDKTGKVKGIIVVRPSLDLPYAASAPSVYAELLRIDFDADLALLRLLAPLARVSLALSTAPARQGDAVYYFGNADEAPTTFGRGVMTRVNYPGKKRRFCQFTGLVWPGMSGGPVLDERGELVGVIAALNVVDGLFRDGGKRVAVPDIGYFVGLPDVLKFAGGVLK